MRFPTSHVRTSPNQTIPKKAASRRLAPQLWGGNRLSWCDGRCVQGPGNVFCGMTDHVHDSTVSQLQTSEPRQCFLSLELHLAVLLPLLASIAQHDVWPGHSEAEEDLTSSPPSSSSFASFLKDLLAGVTEDEGCARCGT